MSRIFWDSMLMIYLLEGQALYRRRAEDLLARSFRRGDSLCTSCLALGEILAGAERSKVAGRDRLIRETLDEMGFTYLPFDLGAVETFSRIRARQNVKAPDAIHLACAASAGVDLFLTNDRELMRLDIPGIQFIADFQSPIL